MKYIRKLRKTTINGNLFYVHRSFKLIVELFMNPGLILLENHLKSDLQINHKASCLNAMKSLSEL